MVLVFGVWVNMQELWGMGRLQVLSCLVSRTD